MKGKYINTVIMMAAMSGRKTRKATAPTETIVSLNDFKIIWSKNGQRKQATAVRPKAALID